MLLPVPVLLEVIEMNESLLAALHEQPVVVVIVSLPVPPALPKLLDAGVTVNVHGPEPTVMPSRIFPPAPLNPPTKTTYGMPATALKLTVLVYAPVPASSFSAIEVSAPRAVPVNTPSKVSNELPAVVTVTGPVKGAVHSHQTERLTASPAIVGSNSCVVALALRPAIEIEPDETRTVLLAKSSLAGGGAAAKVESANNGRRQSSLFIRLPVDRVC